KDNCFSFRSFFTFDKGVLFEIYWKADQGLTRSALFTGFNTRCNINRTLCLNFNSRFYIGLHISFLIKRHTCSIWIAASGKQLLVRIAWWNDNGTPVHEGGV